MVFGKTLGNLIGASKGGPAIGFFFDLGFETLKTLFPGQGNRGGDRAGGYAAVDNTASGSTINVIRKREQIPAVCGTHRVTPAAVTPAWTELVAGNDIDTRQILALQGPHKLEDIEVNGARAASFDPEELQVETREGFATDSPLTLVDKSAFEDIFDEPLPNFKLTQGSTNLLLDQNDPPSNKPTWVTHASKPDADQIWCDFDFPNGLIRSGTTINGTEILMRIRPVGSSTWRNLPSMRIRGNYSERRRYRVKLVFAADPGGLNGQDWNDYTFPAMAFNKLHDAFTNEYSSVWEADDYFGAHEAAGSVAPGGSNTDHLDATDNVATFYLDPDDATDPWPISADGYEISVKRGYGGRGLFTNNWNRYHEIEDTTGNWLLGDLATRALPENSDMVWHSVTTYRDQHPISGQEYALIAIKARNIQLNSVTVKASGYTDDLVGGVWTANQTTSNPASWARRLRTEKRLADPMPASVRDDADFEAWHAECASEGLTFDMVIEGNMVIRNLFGVICEGGYAHPRNGNTRGVFIDNDRSAEEIVGILTPHNNDGAELRTVKPLQKIIQALVVKWEDKDKNYTPQPEKVRYRSGFSASTPNLIKQAVAAPGKVVGADVEEWADRKLAALEKRATVYRVSIDWEHVQFETGQLLGLAWDTLGLKYGSGVIKSLTMSGSNVTGVVLEQTISIAAAAALGDVGLGIRYNDGTIVHHEITNTTDSDTLTFDTAFARPAPNPPIWGDQNLYARASVWTRTLGPGSLCWAGPLNSEEIRVILQGIDRESDERAELTLVDEAPTIHP